MTRKSDWLGSPLRRHVLQSLDMREINLDTIRSAPGDDRHILRDHRNPLGALQEKQSNHHWLCMFLPLIISWNVLMTVPSDAPGLSRHPMGNLLGQTFPRTFTGRSSIIA